MISVFLLLNLSTILFLCCANMVASLIYNSKYVVSYRCNSSVLLFLCAPLNKKILFFRENRGTYDPLVYILNKI